MFRGGGTVSSYGNGIATGLADGGMAGKRGLVDGPGGYAGVDTRTYDRFKGFNSGQPVTQSDFLNFLNAQSGSQVGPVITGGEISEEAMEKFKTKRFFDSQIKVDDSSTFNEETDERTYNEDQLNFPVLKYKDTNTGGLGAIAKDNKTLANLLSDQLKMDAPPAMTETTIQDSIIDEGEPYESPTMTMKQAEMNQGNVMPGVEINEGEVVIRGGGEDEGIQSMADEYFKLMGGEKARGRDISDMLLRFAGSEGDTVMGKFKNYAAAEAKVKSRTEGLNEKATGFAIQQDAQTKLLDKKLKAQSDIADKNLIATVAKLDRDGQYKKKVDDIIRDRFNGDQSKRAEASRIALGDEATIEAAVFDKTAGGMPLSPGSFDLLAAGYTDGPIPGGDLAGISGTFFIPGKMQIITIVEGVVDQNTLKDFSPKA
jgi:hypothetical protein